MVSTVEAVASDYATGATYPDPPISEAPVVSSALGELATAWNDRLIADDLLFESIASALESALSVMNAADGELAGFLGETRVMDS